MVRRILALLTALVLFWTSSGPIPALAETAPGLTCETPEDMALLVSIAKPFGLARAQDGSLYIGDSRGHRVWKLTTDGRLIPFAGTGGKGSDGDGGPALLATLNLPTGLALAPDGSLFIAESGSHKVRKVAPNGTITTVAGKGANWEMGDDPGYSGDNGPAIKAGLKEPWGLALDAAGNLYIADRGNGKVRKVSKDGIITTAAGSHQFGAENNDGMLAIDAKLWGPTGVTIGPDGSLYIADPGFRRVYKVGSNGRISTFAGGGKAGDGALATEASLSGPSGLAFDQAGNLYISDTSAHLIQMVDRTGRIRTVAGSRDAFYLNDGGPATKAKLNMPWGIVPDGAGGLYIADAEHFRVRKIDLTGRIETVAGNGAYTYSEDSITSLKIRPIAVAVAQDGAIYYVDNRRYSGEIIKQSPDGSYAYVVSEATRSMGGIVISGPLGLALDARDRLHVSMADRIIRIEADGTRTHIAGNGAPGFAGDGGPASAAAVDTPVGMLFDPRGNLYFTDAKNHRIRMITPAGIITTVAGNGQAGFGGDGGRALSASFNRPTDLALDRAGNLYINDRSNNRVRKVTSDGTVVTVAGNGQWTVWPDPGVATKVAIQADALTVDDEGRLYIATRERLYQVGLDGMLRQIAGHEKYAPLPDLAPVAEVRLSRPGTMAKDSLGNLYLSDMEFGRIWRLTPDGLMQSVVGPTAGARVQTPYLPYPRLETPERVAADGKGNVWIGDSRTERVYHVAPDGRARLLMSFDGPKTDYGVVVVTHVAGPYGLTLDRQGNLYVLGDNRVFRVTPEGRYMLVAGSGEEQLSGDGGSAIEAGMTPMGIAVAGDGTIYLADTQNYRVRRVTPDGTVSTYAGSTRPDWTEGSTGDGGPATEARIYAYHVAVDAAGNVYVASGSIVRKIAPNGIISTVAGSQNSLAKPAQDGERATEGTFNFITGIAVDGQGALHIAEGMEKRIRKVSPGGIVSTVAGGPNSLYPLGRIHGLAFDPAGNLWFAEPENGRVRALAPDGKVSTLSLREQAKPHPGAVARVEAQAAVVAQAKALQGGTPLSGEELVTRLSATVRQRCATASDDYVLSVLEAAMRSGRVRQSPPVLDALALVYRGRGKIALALTVERARQEAVTGEAPALPKSAKRIRLKVGDPNAEVDGNQVVLDVPPQIVEGRTLVPLRFLTESLGATLKWDAGEQRITITTLKQEIVLWVGRKTAVIGGVTVELDVPPQMIGGRTMVPLRFVTENFGANLTFNPADMSIELTAQE